MVNMQKYTDAVWKWQEEDRKITRNKKAVFGEGGLDLWVKAAASTRGLPSRMPSVEGSTFQGPSALHQVTVSSHVVKGFIVKFTNKKIDKKNSVILLTIVIGLFASRGLVFFLCIGYLYLFTQNWNYTVDSVVQLFSLRHLCGDIMCIVWLYQFKIFSFRQHVSYFPLFFSK